MQTQTRQTTASNQQQIAALAYSLWDQAGRPTGRDMEFWLKAEKQIASAPSAAASKAAEQSAKTSLSEATTSAKPSTFVAPATGPAARPAPTQPRRVSPRPARAR